MLPGPAQGEQEQALSSSVHELAAHRRTYPGQMTWPKHVLNALDEQRQLALEHEIDLFLALMRMYAPSLSRLKRHQVNPEGAHAELSSQRLEALIAIAIQHGKRDVGLGHGARISHWRRGRSCSRE